MKNPFFSVVIPLYNRENRITQALESLRKQSYQDFEVIIVDDYSTDNSYSKACDFPIQNKVVLKNEKNRERSYTRNRGIDIARGKFICFLDSDDYHLDNHLSELHNFIKKHNEKKAFYYSNACNESDNGLRSDRLYVKLENQNIFSYLLYHTINPQRWAVHSEIIKNCQFDNDIPICEDLDLSLRIASKNHDFIHLNKVTTVYVLANDSFTQSDPKKNEREYRAYKKIFSRKELKNRLPRKDKNRLISRCHFFFSIKAYEQKKYLKQVKHAVISFFFFPSGYNGKTNKILFVQLIYGIPFIGNYISKAVKLI